MSSYSQSTSQGSSNRTSDDPSKLQIPARVDTGGSGSSRPGSPPPRKQNASDSQYLTKRAGTNTGGAAASSQSGNDSGNAQGDKASGGGAWMERAVSLGGHGGKPPTARPRTLLPDDMQGVWDAVSSHSLLAPFIPNRKQTGGRRRGFGETTRRYRG